MVINIDGYKIGRYAKFPQELGWDGADFIVAGLLLGMQGRYDEFKGFAEGQTALRKQKTLQDKIQSCLLLEESPDFSYYPRPTHNEFMFFNMAKKWLTWFIDGTLVRFRGFSVIPLVAVVLLAAILVFYVVLNAAFCLDF